MGEEVPTINIKHKEDRPKLSILKIFGLVAVVLLLLIIFIDIRSEGLTCFGGGDCKPFFLAIGGKVFLVDQHLTQDIEFLSNYTTTDGTNPKLSPERAVRVDVIGNAIFYLLLLVITFYLGFWIGGKSVFGVLGGILAVGIYFLGQFLFIFFINGEIVTPAQGLINLFRNLSVLI